MEGGLPIHNKLTILIPCRFNSRRLPGKALLKIGEDPLIGLVYKNVIKSSKLLPVKPSVFVCTDSDEIINYLESENIPYLRTSNLPKNGTERIAEALIKYKIKSEYIIDVQGDEPFVNSEILNLVYKNLTESFPKPLKDLGIILPHQIISKTEADNISIVKMAIDSESKVRYLSRSLIPCNHKKEISTIGSSNFMKHLSVIGFSNKALEKYSSLKQSFLESVEDIELLRALENNISIISPKSSSKTFSIDTRADYLKAKKFILKNN